VGVDGVRVLGVEDLGLPYVYEMCFKYDVTELSTAVKPTLLSVLMRKFGERRVLYIDPDIWVVRPLTEVARALEDHEIVLTPHLSGPIPDDGLAPSEQDILIAGAYNLGFLALADGPQSRALLDWWAERLRDLCRADPAQGLMVDQRWIDLVPTLFPSTHLLRDDTYNVAYWNLHSRELRRRGRGFTVNGAPLTFFHFSGFDPRRPTNLSKHQSRHEVVEGSPLHDLLARYAEQQVASGYETARAWSYGLERFHNGVKLDPVLRKLYLSLDPAERAVFGDPFATDDDSCFLAWATRPEAEDGLSPFLQALYRARRDVAAAFPDLAGADRARYLEWASTQGVREMGYDPALTEPDAHRVRRQHGSAAVSPTAALPAGVNVCGYIRNESGLGSLTRGYIGALDAAGMEVALKDVSSLSVNRSEDPTVTEFHDEHPHPVNLVCVNADQHFVVMEHDEGFFEGRYNIGVWNWELPEFPAEWHDRFGHYDEIWAGSSMIVHALSAVSPVPVVRMPPVLSARTGDRRRGRRSLGAERGEHVFLFIFDFHSYFERKNPLAVIEAFRRAFGPDDHVRLVIKCVNGATDAAGMARLRRAAEGLQVDLIEEYVPYQRVSDLVAACDTYVSLHRSEGIGLTIAEAMAAGKPVIATGWSGNTDFMDVSNSFPVAYELTRLTADVGPYRAGEIWAEPSVEHAAALMRTVVEEPKLAAARAGAARRRMTEEFSVEAVAKVMARRLAVVEARRRAAAGAPAVGAPGALPDRVRLAQQVRAAVSREVPGHLDDGAVVAVVSRGDDGLLALGGRAGWHFPQTDDGTYAGYHPADGADAVRQLSEVQRRGATHLLVPATSGWWLEYYTELAAHLDQAHELVARHEAFALYRLRSAAAHGAPADQAAATPAGEPTHDDRQLTAMPVDVRAATGTSGPVVTVVGADDAPAIEIRVLVGKARA
ncbi:MAG TPA: glycosyltransferase, partial [Acidimicrobiales bacterium]|nr:glycosyltransferase [Acidimicrobiales bacterium]